MNNKDFQLEIEVKSDYIKETDSYKISGTVNVSSGSLLEYYAGNPPTYMFSYGGSGLPYPDAKSAYYNSNNNGSITIRNNKFSFNIRNPNGFYSGLGTKYIRPHVIIRVTESSGMAYQPLFVYLNDGLPYKSLTYSPPPDTWPRSSPLFYYGKDNLPIRSQEQILRDAAYPKEFKYPQNFWGLKPMQ